MKLTFVAVSAPAIKFLAAAGRKIKAEDYPELELKLYNATVESGAAKSLELMADIKDSDFVLTDLMGSPPSVVKTVYDALEEAKGNIVPYGASGREYLRLGKFTADTMKSDNDNKKIDMEAMKKMQAMAETMGKVMPGKIRDMRNYSLIMKYFKLANEENILELLFLILRDYGDVKELPKPKEPIEAAAIAILEPSTRKAYGNLKAYRKAYPLKEGRPTIALLFYGHAYPTDTVPIIAKIKAGFEEFANLLPIAISASFSEIEAKLRQLLLEGDSVDLILNFMSFRLGAGPMGGDAQAAIVLLKEIGVPYLHPFFMTRRTIDQWRESAQGCSTSELMISVMLPELDGCIETFPVGAMAETEYDGDYDVMTEGLTLIEERLERLVGRVKGLLSLRLKENREKKIAFICYNYPPGESNLFGGAFLDTLASMENITEALKAQGYRINPLKKEGLIESFIAQGNVNSGNYSDGGGAIKYSAKDYSQRLKKSSDYHEMLNQWGEAPGTVMTTGGKDFLIPGIVEGNVFIGLQPSRGIHENPEKAYHDKALLPHHQYQAFYQWLREEFKADAIVHVGTHGTLEFLKGKECGISGDCYPDRLLGDIPHIYLYYCGNPSEATIAKRRSNANIVSYQPPVFLQGELYGEYSKLMTLMDNYNQSLAIDKNASEDILQEIKASAKALQLPEALDELEGELYRMKRSLIPSGLHAFGKGFDAEEGKAYVRGLLRYSRGDRASLRELLAASQGLDIDELTNNKELRLIKPLDEACEEIFYHYFEKGELKDGRFINDKNRNEIKLLLEASKGLWRTAMENHELEGLLKVLSGGYNEARMAGDIYRSPEVLPTGYNLYQFDPRLVPTQKAYGRGCKIAEGTLKAYIEENKVYPQSTAVILWGLETSRTQGETFSQILAYLGVRPENKANVWEPRFEIIPMTELGRPRIDVTINICGFFRDMFPNLIEALDDVLHRLFQLEETQEENYFKANSLRLYKKLLAEGYGPQEAKELSMARIFGPKEGAYGTGLTSVIETKNWQQEEELGSLFLDNLQYVYNRSFRGKKIEGLYRENLKEVEIVSQIRSNHEYEITDLDHYYEFFGGLAKSVELVKGRRARLYITDTTGEGVITETADKSIARGMRTRALNPKWIDGMLNHKYHGTQKISKVFENLMGLSATTNSVEEWIYNDLHASYVEDEDLRKRLVENNPYAYMDILQQMMEYYKRGYWQATEQQLEKIKALYLELEEDIEGKY